MGSVGVPRLRRPRRRYDSRERRKMQISAIPAPALAPELGAGQQFRRNWPPTQATCGMVWIAYLGLALKVGLPVAVGHAAASNRDTRASKIQRFKSPPSQEKPEVSRLFGADQAVSTRGGDRRRIRRGIDGALKKRSLDGSLGNGMALGENLAAEQETAGRGRSRGEGSPVLRFSRSLLPAPCSLLGCDRA